MPVRYFQGERLVRPLLPVRLQDTGKLTWLKPAWRVTVEHTVPLGIPLGTINSYYAVRQHEGVAVGTVLRGDPTDSRYYLGMQQHD